MTGGDRPAERAPRSRGSLASLGIAAALAFAGLIVLGVWQIERRAWKHALIAQVDARLYAAPAAAPEPADWPRIAARDAYLRVSLQGRYRAVPPVFAKAVTARGGGYWALSPLDTTGGFTVIVNRGFVPTAAAPPPTGPVRVTGLLRISEPGGGFLRRNDPARDRWYSRDIAAIAAARRFGRVAPYFVDADGASSEPHGPVGGLTVVAFSDNHLVYALTWFGLAALVLVGAGIVARDERRLRRAGRR